MQKLIYQAVEAELSGFLDAYSERRTPSGHAGVVRNGYIPERKLQTDLGAVTVAIPKVRFKTGEPVIFQSALVPRYIRKTHSLEFGIGGMNGWTRIRGFIWADGIYSGLRLEQDKLCALLVIGVNARGEKYFLAIEDDVRESTMS